MKNKIYCTVGDHCHYTGEYRDAVHSLCNLKYSVPESIHITFHNGSYNDYYFIINVLAEEFRIWLTCLGENKNK